MKTESRDGLWNLNFPREMALPETRNGDGLTVADLLDENYSSPIRKAIDRLEALGYDVEGLWLEYISMKYLLKANAEVFQDILELAQARSGIFGVEHKERTRC